MWYSPFYDNVGEFNFTSTEGNFQRIEVTTRVPFEDSFNRDYVGWHYSPDGTKHIWEGDTNFVAISSCSTYVTQIKFYRKIDSIFVDNASGAYILPPGATATLTATPTAGNYLKNWDDEPDIWCDTASARNYIVNSDTTVTAHFAPPAILTVAVNDVTMGATSFDGDFLFRFYQDGVLVSDSVSQFPLRWDCGQTITSFGGGEHNVLFEGQDVIVNAPFYHGAYLTTTNGNINIDCQRILPEGMKVINDSTYSVIPNTTLIFRANPDLTYHLDHWQDDVTDLVDTVTITTDTTVKAFFAPNPTITVAADPNEGGTVTLETQNIIVWGDGENNFEVTLPYTSDGITLSGSGNVSTDSYWLSRYFDGSKFIFTSDDTTHFRRIEVFSLETGQNVAGNASDGWTQHGWKHVWEGDAAQVILSNCTTKVGKIIFYRTNDSIVALNTNDGLYSIFPGTRVAVTATPNANYYLKNWDNEADVNSNIANVKYYSVNTDMVATGHFVHKPILTIASNDSGLGSVIVEHDELPFDTTLDIITFTTIDVNNDASANNGGWFDGTEYYYYRYHSSNDADDWLVSPAVELKAGNQYTFSMQGREISSSCTERFEVKVGTGTTAAVLSAGTVVINATNTPTGNTNWNTFSGTFTPTVDGEYHFGIHCISVADQNILMVKDINITSPTHIINRYHAGVVEGNDANTYIVDYDTMVTVNASAIANHHVAGWEDENNNDLSNVAT